VPLVSRKLHSANTLPRVDWQLRILFIGLFVANHALETTGLTGQAVQALGSSPRRRR
jgi:Na+/H+ antiporter NhaD/arsenite permease-like protein